MKNMQIYNLTMIMSLFLHTNFVIDPYLKSKITLMKNMQIYYVSFGENVTFSFLSCRMVFETVEIFIKYLVFTPYVC